MDNLPEIIGTIKRARIDLSNEKRAQSDLASVFDAAGIKYEREVRLNNEDIVDFMIGGVALEIKVAGARKIAVFRQLRRYAKHPQIKTIIMAGNISMALPQDICGKPTYVVKLGEAWL